MLPSPSIRVHAKTSIPRRDTSNDSSPSITELQASTSKHSQLQAELLHAIADEIGNQCWEFDVHTIMQMLSPKLLKPGRLADQPYPPLSSFNCLVDHGAVQQALSSLDKLDPGAFEFSERATENYDRLSVLFNSCVSNCDKIYDELQCASKTLSPFTLKPRKDRWWHAIMFFAFNRETEDRIDGSAAPLKPSLVAGRTVPKSDSPAWFWSIPLEGPSNAMEICLPVEVKDSWSWIVAQAGAYARAQVSAIPVRLFSLVIGVNHKTRTVRFLIYHRGGVTASEEIDLCQAKGRCAVQRIMFSILLWQNPEDAGIPLFTNGVKSIVPSPGDGKSCESICLQTHQVLFSSLSLCGRGTLVIRAQRTPQPKEPQKDSSHAPSRQFRCTNRAPARREVQPQTIPLVKTRHKQKRSVFAVMPKRYHSNPLQYVRPPNAIGSTGKSPPSVDRVAVVKFSYPHSEKHQIEGEMYDICNGKFGVPEHLVSFEACRLDRSAFSNSIFLPPESDPAAFASNHWDPFNIRNTGENPSPPDYRTLFVTVTMDEGKQLTHCINAWHLAICLLHAHLGEYVLASVRDPSNIAFVCTGWLSILNIGGHGYLHRDVTIGNVLMVEKPVERSAFSTRVGVLKLCRTSRDDEFEIAQGIADIHLNCEADGTLGDDGFWAKLHDNIEDKFLKELVSAAERLEKVLSKLALSTECMAILIDGDIAAELKSCFADSGHEGVPSGTPEFMSSWLRDALEYEEEYVQNPVDDLQSFLWTGLWATIFNPLALERADEKALRRIHKWRTSLRDTDQVGRNSVLISLFEIGECQHALLVRQMSPLFQKWSLSIRELRKRFIAVWNSADLRDDRDRKLHLFYSLALTGVAEFAELLYEQREQLQSL